MTKQQAIAEMRARFHARYPYLSTDEVERLYQFALGAYLTLSFPFDKSIMELPDNRVRDVFWIEACMQEQLERSGCTSMTAYIENGLSATFDASQISNGLRKLITPKVGVPK